MPKQVYSVEAESSAKEIMAHLGKIVVAVKGGNVQADVMALVAELPGLIAAVPQIVGDFEESKLGFVKGANLGLYDVLDALGVK